MNNDGTRRDRWELLRRALWILGDALERPVGEAIHEVDPEVHVRLQKHKGRSETDLEDVKAVLSCLAYSPRVRQQLFGAEPACYDEINLLVDMRNFWAHTRGITKGDLSESLDAAHTVLESLGDLESAQAIRALQANPPPSVQAERQARKQRELDERERRLEQSQRDNGAASASASAQELEAIAQQRQRLQEDTDTLSKERADLELWERGLERRTFRLQGMQSRLEIDARDLLGDLQSQLEREARDLAISKEALRDQQQEQAEREAALDRRQAWLEEKEAESRARNLDRAPTMARSHPQQRSSPTAAGAGSGEVGVSPSTQTD